MTLSQSICYCSLPSTEVYDAAKEMLALNIPVTQETLRNYVIPGLASQNQLDTDGTISGLKEAGVPVPLIVSGMVAFLLDTRDAVEAARLCECVGLP